MFYTTQSTTVTCPGLTMDITPPYEHINLLVLSMIGMFAINTIGLPGDQGAAVTGMHACGLRTPGGGVAVAAATTGLAGQLHTPNGSMLTIGLLSIILAKGNVWTTLFVGSTIRVEGAAPKLQDIVAPPHTETPISTFSCLLRSISYMLSQLFSPEEMSPSGRNLFKMLFTLFLISSGFPLSSISVWRFINSFTYFILSFVCFSL